MFSNFFYKQQIVKIPDSTTLHIKANCRSEVGVSGGGSHKKTVSWAHIPGVTTQYDWSVSQEYVFLTDFPGNSDMSLV